MLKTYTKLGLLLLACMQLFACSSVPQSVEPNTATTYSAESVASHAVTPEVARGFHQVLQLLRQQDYVKASQLLEQLVQQDADLFALQFNLAFSYQQQERYEDALPVLLRAVELAPTQRQAQNQLGLLYRQLGRFDDARNTYEALLQQAPDFANAHFNLGILCELYLLQPPCALAHYQRAMALQPDAYPQLSLWLADLTQRYPELAQ